MKKLFFILLTILLFTLFMFGKFINSDKPANGIWEMKPAKIWEIDSVGDDFITRVGGLRVDDSGNVYAMELKIGRIFVFGKDGKFLHYIGKKGEGPGEYKMAYNFSLIGNRVVVPEMGRLHIFNKDGKFIKTYVQKSFMFPRAFLDENRFIYVKSDREGMGKEPEKVNIFNLKTEKFKTLFTIPPEKAISAQKGGMRIVIKDSQTTPGMIIALAKGGIIFGKSDKYELKKIDLSGKELMSFSLEGRSRKSISESFKRKRFENIMVNGGRMPKEMIDMMVKNMPDIATYFTRITVDETGKIYVYVSDLENTHGQDIDIFSSKGKYLYSVKLHFDEYEIKSALVIKNGFLYFFGENEDGEGALLKFRVVHPD